MTKSADRKDIKKNDKCKEVPANERNSFWSCTGDTSRLGYFGYNGSSFMDVAYYTEKQTEDAESEIKDDAFDTWKEKASKPKPEEINGLMAEGIALIEAMTCEANLKISIFEKTQAHRAFEIGEACLCLKELTRALKLPWGPWAEKNLSNLGKRNRERYMLLARRKDCHNYAHLGIERLELLCSATKNEDGDDKITKLFDSYEITYDPHSESSVQFFITQVEAAIICERLKKKGIEIEHQEAIDFINRGVQIDSALIKDLATMKKYGGDPKKRLRDLAANGGIDPGDSEGSKRPQSFNNLSYRLIQTIDGIINDVTNKALNIKALDIETFIKLSEKIDDLQKVMNQVNKKAA